MPMKKCPGLFCLIVFLFVSAAARLSTAQTYSVLYSFTGGVDGAYPQAGLVMDSAGNLYGNTVLSYPENYEGSVYQLSPSGKFSVLYDFTTGGTDGGRPDTGLILDASDNLYGRPRDGEIPQMFSM